MLLMIENLQDKYELELEGSFEVVPQGDSFFVRYNSTNSVVGTVSSRLLDVGQYVADLLSFLECVALLEATLN